MVVGRLLTGSNAVNACRARRRRRNQPAENAGGAPEASVAVSADSSALDEEDHDRAERARLLRKANAHERVATQISDLMQGNVARIEDLRLLARLVPPADQHARGSGGSRLPAGGSLRNEIEVLDRIIAWQIKTISWHADEGRRLRQEAARIRGRQAPGDAPDREMIWIGRGHRSLRRQVTDVPGVGVGRECVRVSLRQAGERSGGEQAAVVVQAWTLVSASG